MGRLAIISILVASLALPVVASGAEKDNEQYIKVEIRGTLETGLVAIGGETTGTIIKVGNVIWELDLGGNQVFQDLAKKLHQETALVAGTYQKIKGVEMPERHIVNVTSLKPADEK